MVGDNFTLKLPVLKESYFTEVLPLKTARQRSCSWRISLLTEADYSNSTDLHSFEKEDAESSFWLTFLWLPVPTTNVLVRGHHKRSAYMFEVKHLNNLGHNGVIAITSYFGTHFHLLSC